MISLRFICCPCWHAGWAIKHRNSSTMEHCGVLSVYGSHEKAHLLFDHKANYTTAYAGGERCKQFSPWWGNIPRCRREDHRMKGDTGRLRLAGQDVVNRSELLLSPMWKRVDFGILMRQPVAVRGRRNMEREGQRPWGNSSTD